MSAADYVRVFTTLLVIAIKWVAPALVCLWADDRETADSRKYRDVVVRDLGCEAY
jgi:hypothetical protein